MKVRTFRGPLPACHMGKCDLVNLKREVFLHKASGTRRFSECKSCHFRMLCLCVLYTPCLLCVSMNMMINNHQQATQCWCVYRINIHLMEYTVTKEYTSCN